jgi:hypothetical protein
MFLISIIIKHALMHLFPFSFDEAHVAKQIFKVLNVLLAKINF